MPRQRIGSTENTLCSRRRRAWTRPRDKVVRGWRFWWTARSIRSRGKERTAQDPPLPVLLDVRDARELRWQSISAVSATSGRRELGRRSLLK